MTDLSIQNITFKNGSSSVASPLILDVPNVTIIVGPNNSGKSLALREIENLCYAKDTERKIVTSITLNLPTSAADAIAVLKTIETTPPAGESNGNRRFWINRPVLRDGDNPMHDEIREEDLEAYYSNNNERDIRRSFVRYFTLRLDGRTRFELVTPKKTGPLDGPAKNHLWSLFVDDSARDKVRSFTESAFGRYFVIDPTGMTTFRARLSDRAPACRQEEQALDEAARKFHEASALVTDLGDGVQASVGLVAAVMSLADRILLIDEPEAFLHPTLARRLGEVLSTTASDRGASLLVATHSADFLLGCIQSVSKVLIVRLTHNDKISTARSIAPDEVKELMNDPLLRSANALRALFHQSVVVTEADADRAFYDEINYRLQIKKKGIPDALFLNAQNWQTIPRIIEPLRRIGIPAAAVFDFDVITDEDFKKIWPMIHVSQNTLQSLQNARNNIQTIIKRKPRSTYKKDGVSAFSGSDETEISNFLKTMGDYGVFFVTVGELEGWLSSSGNPRINNKAKWITSIFEYMGSDPTDSGYISAGIGDVWEFIEGISRWIANPNRLGIPD